MNSKKPQPKSQPKSQIVQAKFKGDDILDFKKGETYQLEVINKGKEIIITKATGGTPMIYQSEKDFFKKWDNIEPQKKQLPKYIIEITENSAGAIEVKGNGNLDIMKTLGGLELFKNKILSTLVNPQRPA